jgi:hypothetical protein
MLGSTQTSCCLEALLSGYNITYPSGPGSSIFDAYGITTAVKPLILSKKQIIDLVDEEFFFDDHRFDYKEEITISILMPLLQLLDVDKVLLTQSGSKLDCNLKVDIAIKQGSKYIGFQVKSSKYGYDKYEVLHESIKAIFAQEAENEA